VCVYPYMLSLIFFPEYIFSEWVCMGTRVCVLRLAVLGLLGLLVLAVLGLAYITHKKKMDSIE